jgi:hypothetical protein
MSLGVLLELENQRLDGIDVVVARRSRPGLPYLPCLNDVQHLLTAALRPRLYHGNLFPIIVHPPDPTTFHERHRPHRRRPTHTTPRSARQAKPSVDVTVPTALRVERVQLPYVHDEPRGKGI